VDAVPHVKSEATSKRKRTKVTAPPSPPSQTSPQAAKRAEGAGSKRSKAKPKEQRQSEDQFFEEDEEDYGSYEPYDRIAANRSHQMALMPPGMFPGRMEGEQQSPARSNGYHQASTLAQLLWEMNQKGQLNPVRGSKIL